MRSDESGKSERSGSSGPSWRTMLLLMGAAIVVAALIAYRMIYPFFHHYPR